MQAIKVPPLHLCLYLRSHCLLLLPAQFLQCHHLLNHHRHLFLLQWHNLLLFQRRNLLLLSVVACSSFSNITVYRGFFNIIHQYNNQVRIYENLPISVS